MRAGFGDVVLPDESESVRNAFGKIDLSRSDFDDYWTLGSGQAGGVSGISSVAFWNNVNGVVNSMSENTNAFLHNNGNGSFSVTFYEGGSGMLGSAVDQILSTNATLKSVDDYGMQRWQGSARGFLHNPSGALKGYGRDIAYGQKEKGDRLSWDATNTTLGALGLANGTKLTMLEGGAALNRGMSISKVNSISMIRTYGAAGAKYVKYAKGLGVVASVVTTGYSVGKVIDQYNLGGWSEVGSHRDAVDAGVGIIGLGATGLAAFGIISNPVGWGIGIGILIYGGTTLIYDAVNND